MKMLISGSTGMVGLALYMKLYRQQIELTRLVRSVSKASGNDIAWDGQSVPSDTSRFEGFDAVIHLAGESIAAGRWTEAKKKRIRDSRVAPTENLSKLLASLENPPKAFVVASAIGYYGNCGADILDETSAAGTGFLPDVCKDWEAATKRASDKGIRTVNLRSGIILSADGGALKKMLCPFKLGIGGKLGSGTQYMSWVALDDVIGAIETAVDEFHAQWSAQCSIAESGDERRIYVGDGNGVESPDAVADAGIRRAAGVRRNGRCSLTGQRARRAEKTAQTAGYAFEQTKIEDALRSLLLPG